MTVHMTALPLNAASSFDLQGKILRKKKISTDYLKVAIQEDGKEKSTTVYIPRKEPVCTTSSTPSEFNFLYLDAVIHVVGNINTDSAYHHVTQCNLVKCAPNRKMINEVLALPNYSSFASTMGMDEAELQRLVDEQKSQKVVLNTIIERITGAKAKAPPRYRPGRVKRRDMDILENKEAEGRDANHQWSLCMPCQPPIEVSFDRKREESVANVPDGAEDLPSAHGKLTRSEYLETKKNHQATWFIERMKLFDVPPTQILDVGGGRGDLAVQIAINFPEAYVIIVDSNESSVLAGKEFAAKCNVEDQIEFCCMDFSEYAQKYEAEGENNVDFVVALHACGDLSDMALSFASSHNCKFIICPCCYPKRYLAPFVPHWHGLVSDENEIDTLSRLVELDDHREISRRAMIVVNSMRQSAFLGDQIVVLEEFDDKISKRNIALVGDGLVEEVTTN